MSGLPPKKQLDITFKDARKLPLAVVVRRENVFKVYRVDAEDTRSYFNNIPDFPPTDAVEALCKPFGSEISIGEFERASVYPLPALEGTSIRESQESDYVIYRAKFSDLDNLYHAIGRHNPTFQELVERIEGKPFKEVDKNRAHYLNQWVQDLLKQDFARCDPKTLRLQLTEKAEICRRVKS